MFVTVYVDMETWKELVFKGGDFDACLKKGDHETISVTVPVDALYETDDDEIVSVHAELAYNYINKN